MYVQSLKSMLLSVLHMTHVITPFNISLSRCLESSSGLSGCPLWTKDLMRLLQEEWCGHFMWCLGKLWVPSNVHGLEVSDHFRRVLYFIRPNPEPDIRKKRFWWAMLRCYHILLNLQAWMLNLSSQGKNTLLKYSAKGNLVKPPDTCGAEVGHKPLSGNHIPFPSFTGSDEPSSASLLLYLLIYIIT